MKIWKKDNNSNSEFRHIVWVIFYLKSHVLKVLIIISLFLFQTFGESQL